MTSQSNLVLQITTSIQLVTLFDPFLSLNTRTYGKAWPCIRTQVCVYNTNNHQLEHGTWSNILSRFLRMKGPLDPYFRIPFFFFFFLL